MPGPDPLDILQSYRANPRMDDAICFGMNCIVTEGAGSGCAWARKWRSNWRFDNAYPFGSRFRDCFIPNHGRVGVMLGHDC